MSYLSQLLPTLLRPSPLLNWSSPILDSLAVQLAQEIPAICLPGIGLQETTTPASFYMGLGAPNSRLSVCTPSALSPEASHQALLLGLLKESSINGFAEARSNLKSSFPLQNKKGVLFGLFARLASCDRSPNSDYLQAEREMAITKSWLSFPEETAGYPRTRWKLWLSLLHPSASTF